VPCCASARWRGRGAGGRARRCCPRHGSKRRSNRARSPWSGLGYGYGWFVGRAGGGPLALARGYGGQVIAVAPAAEMTIAITSDPNRPARSAGYFGDLMGLIDRLVVA